MPKTVSTKQIAEMIGVSRSTVTRALNNDEKIKHETRRKIHALAQRLGYQKNSLASSLVSGRTNIIGCIVPDVMNPFFGEMVSHINTQLSASGMGMLLGISNDDPRLFENLVTTFRNYRVEGVLLNETRTGYVIEHIADLKRSGLPLVVMGEARNLGLDSVMADDEVGAYEMTSFLARNQYQRIAFIGDIYHVLVSKRIQGYKNALLTYRLPFFPEFLRECTMATVRQTVNALYQLPQPPDAIFCSNDALAIEVHHALERLGHRVPDEVGLVGFDNIAAARELAQPLTTVDLQVSEVVRVTIELLTKRIEAKRAGEPEPIEPCNLLVKPKLCVRETTRRLVVPE